MEFGLFTRYISWSRRVFKSGIWEDSFDLKTEKSMKLFVSGLNKFLFFQVYIILYPNIVILLVISAFKQKVCNLLILMILLFIIRH